MSWIDYAILGVLLVSVLIGLFRGFVREVMALVVWVAAFWVAWQFADEVAAFLEPHVDVPSARTAIAFVGLLVATLLAGGILSSLLALLVESTGLSGTDRLLGMCFGAARGAVLLVVAVFVGGLTPLPKDPWWQSSILIPRLQAMAEWAAEEMPPEIAEYFDFAPLPGGTPAELPERAADGGGADDEGPAATEEGTSEPTEEDGST